MDAAGTDRQPVVAGMHPQHLDRAIAATAARQEGVIGRDQLAALPLSHTAIAKRIAAGRLHPVFPGAYSVGVPARSTAAIRVAALLSTAPSYISHRDAAEEHGLVDPIPGPIHVTVAHGRRLRRDRTGLTWPDPVVLSLSLLSLS